MRSCVGTTDRLDGGDAETGFGADVGGGLALADPWRGLSLNLRARTLVVHEAAGFRLWGASAAFAFDPEPSDDAGPSLSLNQSWGASPSGGMGALLNRETLAGLTANDRGTGFPAGRRLEGEAGYGMHLGGGFTGTPNIGFGLSSQGARDWRLGWRVTSSRAGYSGLRFDLDLTRREAANDDVERAVTLRARFR